MQNPIRKALTRKPCAFLLFVSVVSLALGVVPSAIATTTRSTDASCPVGDTPSWWSAEETWVWEQVCSGKVANLNEHGTAPDRTSTYEAHSQPHLVSGRFLEEILLKEPFRSAIPRQGVRLMGATFRDPIDLDGARLAFDLWLDGSTFEHGASLMQLETSGALTFDESRIFGALDLSNSHIGRYLRLGGGKFGSIDLAGATVDGDLTLGTPADKGGKWSRTTVVTGDVIMTSIRIGRILNLAGASLQNVMLQGSRIADQMNAEHATLHGTLNMDSAQVGQYLWINDGTFANVDLASAQIDGDVIASNANILDTLEMDSAHVGQLLTLDSVTAKSIVLAGADIGGKSDLTHAKVGGTLVMKGIQIDRDLVFDGAAMADVDLEDAKLQGDVTSDRQTQIAKLNLNGAQISRDVAFIGSTFTSLSLIDTRVSGGVSLDGTHIGGQLDLDRAQVTGSVFFRGGSNAPGLQTGGKIQPAVMTYCTVGGIFDISGTSFDAVDLTGTKIGQTLRLGKSDGADNVWHPASFLSLRHVSVQAFYDGCEEDELKCLESWPTHLELDGFTYSYPGEYSQHAAAATDMAARSADWWIGLLRKQRAFSPQPYQYAAANLRSLGRPDAADEVQYAERKSELGESITAIGRALGGSRYDAAIDSLVRAAALSVLWAAIGFGIGYHTLTHTVLWVALWVFLGVLVMRRYDENKKHNLPQYPIAYSFDMLLPVVRLNEAHYKIDLQSGARVYFYVHKIMGYVLALFLVAGLSGVGGK